MDENYHSLDSDDREEWDRLWGARTLHLIPGGCKLLFRDAPLTVKAAAISDDPPQFAARIFRETEHCPVCGESTSGCLRVAATLTMEYEMPPDWPWKLPLRIRRGVWAHQSCFERCQDTGRPAGIPW
jgi:hypothetical protein